MMMMMLMKALGHYKMGKHGAYFEDKTYKTQIMAKDNDGDKYDDEI